MSADITFLHFTLTWGIKKKKFACVLFWAFFIVGGVNVVDVE